MSKLRLSHSASSKYQECSKAYEYHYIHKLRSRTKSGALFFGTAVDKALDAMLLDPKKGREVFETTWEKQELNGRLETLRDSTLIVYANADYDSELLLPEDLEALKQYTDKDVLEELGKIYRQKEAIGFDLLPKEKKKLLNAANWYCLRRKGHAMLTALEVEVLPNITEVLATQKQVELVNEQGDSVIGYVDLVCKWKGYDEPIIFDLKTAARPYDKDAVLTSPQLALYTYAAYNEYKTHTAGFIVLSKQINKNKVKICKSCGNDGSGKSHKTCDAIVSDARCHGEWTTTVRPTASVQVLIDSIPERYQNMVVENITEIGHAIQQKVFTRNLKSCIRGPIVCDFYDLCHKDDSSKLIKENEDSKYRR